MLARLLQKPTGYMNARRNVKPTSRGPIRTPEQVKADFERTGTSVSEWARTHNFHPSLVFEVLEGRVKGHRGKSHKIAVLLGLKEGEVRT
jgi:gp16 family phage-associated protein